VRAFATVTMGVLLVIGGGVAVLAVDAPSATTFSCPSARSCFNAALASGINQPLLAPADTPLSFEQGVLVWSSPNEWEIGVSYADPGTLWSIEWSVAPWPFPSDSCRAGTGEETRRVVVNTLKVCYLWFESPRDTGFGSFDAGGVASFVSGHVDYVATLGRRPPGATPATMRAWLLQEVGQQQTW